MYSKLGTVSILTTQSSSNAESEVNKYIFVQAGYLKDLIVVMLKLMKLLPQIS